ncbi:MAG: Mu transposase C-terminal domain-containing protein [Magnetospirillum sp.]|nr:Mu transposase C-terminal domain-containing protein [Magnetospirillum sp.]
MSKTDWQWLSAAEIKTLGVAGMPQSESGIWRKAQRDGWNRPEREWHAIDNPGGIWRKREAKQGGGVEYHYSLLPVTVQLKLQADNAETVATFVRAETCIAARECWAWFDRQPDKVKAKAKTRLDILAAVEALVNNGQKKELAAQMVAAAHGVAKSSIWGWYHKVAGQDRADWLPFLADRYAGRTAEAECSPEAWEFFKADYLRPEPRTAEACYSDLEDAAKQHGWTIPSLRTLMRKLEREIPEPVRVLLKEGAEALKRLYPAQQRRRDVFHALEAVNGDGHKFDVFVRWHDGDIIRPMLVALQDVYSGKILSWRLDKTENREVIRLAFGDLVEDYGIPAHVYFDNTRAFANKLLTAGSVNRFRFKTRDEDPVGIVTALGAQVHFVTPYSGQSKPIERAWRDLADRVSTHPAFAGAYTGKNPMAKPENYGSKAVPLDKFLEVLASEINKHNARPGRRTGVCRGELSFDQAFAASYATAPIKKATEEQRRMWLLAAEGVKTHAENGSVKILENRYWDDFLSQHRGDKVVARFDPQDLMAGLWVYDLAGRYLGHAPVIEAAGFNDVAAAQEHSRRRRAFIRAQKDLAAAEIRLTAAEVDALMPVAEATPTPEAKVVSFAPPAGMAKPSSTAVTKGKSKRPVAPPVTPAEQARLDRLAAEMAAPAQVVQLNTKSAQFARAVQLDAALQAGETVDPSDAKWLETFKAGPVWRSRKSIMDEHGLDTALAM